MLGNWVFFDPQRLRDFRHKKTALVAVVWACPFAHAGNLIPAFEYRQNEGLDGKPLGHLTYVIGPLHITSVD